MIKVIVIFLLFISPAYATSIRFDEPTKILPELRLVQAVNLHLGEQNQLSRFKFWLDGNLVIDWPIASPYINTPTRGYSPYQNPPYLVYVSNFFDYSTRENRTRISFNLGPGKLGGIMAVESVPDYLYVTLGPKLPEPPIIGLIILAVIIGGILRPRLF